MPELLRPTPRPSIREPLGNLYRNIRTGNAGGAPSFGAGIRSHLLGNNLNTMAWGLSKRAGGPNYITTNRFVDTQYDRTFQPNEFVAGRQKGNPTSFNGYSMNYARNAYDHDNTPYSY